MAKYNPTHDSLTRVLECYDQLYDSWFKRGNGYRGGDYEGARENLRAAVEQLKPIPVSERLPDDGTLVLGFASAGCWDVLYWGNGCWSDGDQHFPTEIQRDEITHWLPLPPKPE